MTKSAPCATNAERVVVKVLSRRILSWMRSNAPGPEVSIVIPINRHRERNALVVRVYANLKANVFARTGGMHPKVSE